MPRNSRWLVAWRSHSHINSLESTDTESTQASKGKRRPSAPPIPFLSTLAGIRNTQAHKARSEQPHAPRPLISAFESSSDRSDSLLTHLLACLFVCEQPPANKRRKSKSHTQAQVAACLFASKLTTCCSRVKKQPLTDQQQRVTIEFAGVSPRRPRILHRVPAAQTSEQV